MESKLLGSVSGGIGYSVHIYIMKSPLLSLDVTRVQIVTRKVENVPFHPVT